MLTFKKNSIYLFAFGCVGSSLLHGSFSPVVEIEGYSLVAVLRVFVAVASPAAEDSTCIL